MVKDHGQTPPAVPAGVPDDALHHTANAIHSASIWLLRDAARHDGSMALDGPRASLLSVVAFAGPQQITRLAEIEHVTPPAITKLVAALEADGLVVRERPDHDRRLVLVRATAAGRRVLERGRAARLRAIATRLAGLSDRDLATVRRAAELLARVL